MTQFVSFPKKPHHTTRDDSARIVVTGMGLVSPLGCDLARVWSNLLAGKSGICALEFDTQEFRAKVGAYVQEFDITRYMSPKDSRRYDPFIHYGVAAAADALLQAKLIDNPKDGAYLGADRYRAGVVMGSGIGGVGLIDATATKLANEGPRKISPFFVPASIINMTAGQIAIRHSLAGANLATATACSTSAHALGIAMRLLAAGDADVLVAGGSEKASGALGIGGFSAMMALSQNPDPAFASCPFDIQRDGFVLGDGAGALVLETLAHAKARKAHILAELVGFGMSDDASHITAPPQDGEGAYRAMAGALADAGLNPQDIGYINAHGTSTPIGDAAESAAILRLFGADTPVSSTKSMTGHLIGAAGAVEAIFCIQALTEQTLPATANLTHPDPSCGVCHIQTPRKVSDLTYVLSNSFGFGGTNASLVFARWSGA